MWEEDGIQIQIEVLLTDEPESHLLALNGFDFESLRELPNEGRAWIGQKLRGRPLNGVIMVSIKKAWSE